MNSIKGSANSNVPFVKTNVAAVSKSKEIALHYLMENPCRPHDFSPKLTYEFSRLHQLSKKITKEYQRIDLNPTHSELNLVFQLLKGLPNDLDVTQIYAVENRLLVQQFENRLLELEKEAKSEMFDYHLENEKNYKERIKVLDNFRKELRPYPIEVKVENEPNQKLMNVKVIYGCHATSLELSENINCGGIHNKYKSFSSAKPKKLAFTGEDLLGKGDYFRNRVWYAVRYFLENKECLSSNLIFCALSFSDPIYPIIGDVAGPQICSDINRLYKENRVPGFNAHLAPVINLDPTKNTAYPICKNQVPDYYCLVMCEKYQSVPRYCVVIQKRTLSGKKLNFDYRQDPRWLFENISKRVALKPTVRDYFLLGRCYQKGIGVPSNLSEALMNYEKGFSLVGSYNPLVYTLAKLIEKGDQTLAYKAHPSALNVREVAIEYYNRAAKDGHIKSQLWLGRYYKSLAGSINKNEKLDENQKSEKIKECYRLVYDFFEAAALNQSPEGQFFIGLCFEEGIGIAEEKKHAFKWYEKSGRQGFAPALFKLGVYYSQGIGIKQDLKKGKYYLEYSALLEEPNALYYLGMQSLAEGENYETKRKAYLYFKRAADLDHLESLFQTGRFEMEGIGTSKNLHSSVEYLTQAANQGHGGAAFELAKIYKGSSHNFSTRKHYLERTIHSGCQFASLAKIDLAELLLEEKSENYIYLARQYLNQVIEDPKALYLLGVAYEEEGENEIDNEQAKIHYEKQAKICYKNAIQSGYPAAQISLNLLEIKKKPFLIAIYPFIKHSKAALEGKVEDVFELGRLFKQIKEFKMAYYNFKCAAAMGHQKALDELISLEYALIRKKDSATENFADLKVSLERAIKGDRNFKELALLFEKADFQDKADYYNTFSKK